MKYPSVLISQLRKQFEGNLQDWWRESGLKTIYLLGSQTTGDANKSSDIDLLGIKQKITGNEVEVRIKLKKLWQPGTTKIKKIGIRIRTHEEIETFQNRMLLWGYTLDKSIYVYGEYLPLSADRQNPKFDLLGLEDCLIERIWCDNLFLARCGFSEKMFSRIYIKSVLDLIHFDLLLEKKLCFNHKERLAIIENHEKKYLFPYERGILEALQTDDLDIKWLQKLYHLRISYLKKIWRKINLVLKVNSKEKYAPYWGLTERNVYFFQELLTEKNTSKVNIQYRNFFLDLVLIIDKMRIGIEERNDKEFIFTAIKKYFNPTLNVYGINEIDLKKKINIAELLFNVEKVRHNTYPLAKRDWS